MNKYIFKTNATMKQYNNKRWWIDSNIVTDKHIEANTVDEALQQFKTLVADKHYIDISNNALRTKEPMYIDTPTGEAKQVGYVITAKADFEDNYKWTAQYIDLWVTIITVTDTVFEEVQQ